jgi:hypothetical protein
MVGHPLGRLRADTREAAQGLDQAFKSGRHRESERQFEAGRQIQTRRKTRHLIL